MNETRRRILAATREIYLREGAEAVTMRSVAAQVGVTPTALYRHFRNKDALVAAVIAEGFQTFGSYLHRALTGDTPGERLRLSGEAYLTFALEQPELYRTLFMTLHPAYREGDAASPDRRQAATFRFLVDRVGECIRSGEIRQDDSEDVAVALWAHVHGLVSLYLVGAVPQPEPEFRRKYAESLGRLFRGLQAP